MGRIYDGFQDMDPALQILEPFSVTDLALPGLWLTT